MAYICLPRYTLPSSQHSNTVIIILSGDRSALFDRAAVILSGEYGAAEMMTISERIVVE